jgi:hypothetical protein
MFMYYFWNKQKFGVAVRLVFATCSVRISSGTPAILTEVLCSFTQSIQANSEIMTYIRPLPTFSKYFPIKASVILQLDVIESLY